ncbi:sugar ABC transporter permease (plasmid) [Glaciihabitans sp. INWT7]|uniref:carbohydrate ABC transporter permease n=1 Tax=Glaciihabitans sp. INWT7 TaxID=2596912 RepID=UPI0016233134|nr:sugar ABC transporter permease [Glaciihabitans sp. INWT7]QNE48637.1 sugar ABC transporter permease [Glaciihabitans sp. INWT7]
MSTHAVVASATARASRRRRPSGMERAKARAGWVLLAPALLHSAIFIALPGVILVVLSFIDFKLLGVPDFVGFDNYRKLFADANFGPAVLNTLFYTVVVVPGGMAIALLVALGLNQKLRLRPLFRTAFYLPVVTSTVAVATVWEWVYNPQSGLANQILSFFGLARSGWLTDPNIALPALAVVGLWQGLGTKMVLYLGGLQGVSPELLEAARLDGASPWQVFWNVTWPALRPVHFFVVVTSIATSFQAFDLVYVTTQGGPINATRVLAYDIFQNAFGNFEFGQAAAETMVMLVVLASIIYLARRTQRESD